MSSYHISGGGPVGRSGSSFTSQASSTSLPLGGQVPPDGRPLDKVFSFDSFANSFSLPNTSDSFYQQQAADVTTPSNLPHPPPHPQEGQALVRITDSVGAPSSSLSTRSLKREPVEEVSNGQGGQGEGEDSLKRQRTEELAGELVMCPQLVWRGSVC